MRVKLIRLFLAIIATVMLPACADRTPLSEPLPSTPEETVKNPLLILSINTVNQGNAGESSVKEIIKTLRIIMIHEEGGQSFIEANRLIDTHDAEHNRFTYLYQKSTVPGKKRFYLIANEASVAGVSLTDGTFPGGLTNPSLHTLLEYFGPTMADVDSQKPAPEVDYTAADFENLMQALYFESLPAYELNGQEVYLPYSAFYSGFEIKQGDTKVDFTSTPMHLVPAATKFTFKFINERTAEDVAIDYLAVKATNRTSYLFANIDPLEQKKSIMGENYYWIDWLHLISQASQENTGAEDNNNFNNRYGWIKEYFVPQPADTLVHYFVPDGPADSPEAPSVKSSSWILPVAAQADNGRVTATTTEFGPLYVGESRYFIEEELAPDLTDPTDPDATEKQDTDDPDTETPTQTVEKYFLKIKLRNISAFVDSKSLAEVKEAETEISNLKALFRNTSVLITITLREGGVNIYAEPVPWNKKVFYGYVKDEDEIK